MNTENTNQNKATVRRFFDEFNKHEQRVFTGLVTQDYLLDFPGGPGQAHGLEGIIQATGGFLATFPDLHFALDTVVAEADNVAVAWTMHGTQSGPLGPVPGTGKPVTLTGTSLMRLVDGKIAEDRVRADLIGLMQQIGAFPSPEPAGL